MLNISDNSIKDKFPSSDFYIFNKVVNAKVRNAFPRLIVVTLVVIIIIMFLPWTQNVKSPGKVVTLRPDQRPQSIHSVIAGKIEKWYVQEGDMVKKGDTIVFITEVKDDYFDSRLLDRTASQKDLKELTARSYAEKVVALEQQYQALSSEGLLKQDQLKIKLKQLELKLQSDSMNYQAALINSQVANDQFTRMKELYDQGLKSLTDLESRNLKLQSTKALEIQALNTLLTSKNEYINTQIEMASVKAKYASEIAKISAEKYTALSSQYDAEGTVNKMENQLSNYEVRSGMYYITAPQDGYITKTIYTGIGETFKEGEALVTIMPAESDLAVEIFVDAIDLPLVNLNQEVRIQFDGWPAIVFSGWPNYSFGTFSGRVYAIDQYTSENGKFRVLVKPDENADPWPKVLRFGCAAHSMMLLNDVPIWYELWRKVNGFPPDYYTIKTSQIESNEK